MPTAHVWQTECPQGITRGHRAPSLKFSTQMSQHIDGAIETCEILDTNLAASARMRPPPALATDGRAGRQSRARGTGWTLCRMPRTAQFLGMSSALVTLCGALQLGQRCTGNVSAIGIMPTAHVWQKECPQGKTRGHRAPSLKFSAQMSQHID